MGLVWSWLATVDEKKKISRQIDKEILQVRILVREILQVRILVRDILQVRILGTIPNFANEKEPKRNFLSFSSKT